MSKGRGGGGKNMLEKKEGSAKIKHDIFNIAPAPPSPPLNK